MSPLRQTVVLQTVLWAFVNLGWAPFAWGVNATWSDELDLHPDVVRPDGNVWRNCNVDAYDGFCEATGELNAIVQQRPEGTWFIPETSRRSEGSVPWNGNEAEHVGPLVDYQDMSFELRFRFVGGPLFSWPPDVVADDGLVTPDTQTFVDRNVLTIEQESFGTVRWGMEFGYERRPGPDFGFDGPEFGRSMSLSYLAVVGEQPPYTVEGASNNIRWADVPIEDNTWYRARAVTDWTSANKTLTFYFGKDGEPLVQVGDALDYGENQLYPEDGGLTVIKQGRHAAIELDYLRAFRGVVGPNTPINAAAGVAAADFNSDGRVDSSDFLIWQSNFGSASGMAMSQGDTDADGNVDGGDFLTWQRLTGPGASVVSPVPEPAVSSLMIALFCCVFQMRLGGVRS